VSKHTYEIPSSYIKQIHGSQLEIQSFTGAAMTELILDGQTLPLDGSVTLAERLAEIMGNLETDGRVVRQIYVDGHPYPENIATLVGTIQSASWEKISLISESIEQILFDTLSSAVLQVTDMLRSIDTAGHKLQLGEDEEALPLIVSIAEALQSYTNLIDFLAKQDLLDAASVQNEIEILGHILQRIMSVWQSEDYVRLADLLLYEVAPVLDKGKQQIAEVALDMQLHVREKNL
jgi:hypothetical protein